MNQPITFALPNPTFEHVLKSYGIGLILHFGAPNLDKSLSYFVMVRAQAI